ncbi:MAG TPA: hypothetical protein VKR82_04120 [Candidatus Acidoferrales bacterium]|jgi:hypothetical protein|nr:hypothetical protein [Candidatus Acidoferrales bacterium]
MMSAKHLHLRPLCLVFILGACTIHVASAPRVQSTQGRLLTQQIPKFESHNITRLDALIRLTQQNHIPLGVEDTDRELLSDSVDFVINSGTVGSALTAMFKGAHGYDWSESNGVLSISKKFEGKRIEQNWYGRVIPEFHSRSATVEELSNLLRMDLALLDNPQIHGFAGTFPGGEGRRLPPFDLRNQTVREVLNEIVRRYRDAAWVSATASAISEKEQVRPEWAIVFYHDPPLPLSQLCCLNAH